MNFKKIKNDALKKASEIIQDVEKTHDNLVYAKYNKEQFKKIDRLVKIAEKCDILSKVDDAHDDYTDQRMKNLKSKINILKQQQSVKKIKRNIIPTWVYGKKDVILKNKKR